MRQLLYYSILLFTSSFIINCDINNVAITTSNDILTETETDVNSDNNNGQFSLYFPPIDTDTWNTISPKELNWNTNELDALYTYLESNDTRAFIILKDGKIVTEKYFGLNALGTDNFNKDSFWYWASAAKTVISLTIGIAQEENYININNKTSDYLEKGWTSLSEEKENLITIKHQLSMSTGLNYDIDDANCTDSNCLTYNKDAGEEWYYYNAPYLLLREVINKSTEQNYRDYIQEKIENKIGMSNSYWVGDGLEAIYWSKPRDMARFGLLILNQGTWDETSILSDENYFEEMTTTSQDLNEAYGYLWWLNGKDSVIYPSSTITLNQELASNAPDDMISAIGKNGQFINVIPSENMVVIRMGEAPSDTLVPITFHNEMWKLINAVIN